MKKPACISHYTELQEAPNHHPNSEEPLCIGAPFGRHFGLRRLGIHHNLLPPGRRSSWPHAEEDEEEFVDVIAGTPDVWIDGVLHRLHPGDGVGFPCGTGISHTFIDNTELDVELLVVGEAAKRSSRIFYPLHEERKAQVGAGWWTDVPKQALGPHDGLPDQLRRERAKPLTSDAPTPRFEGR